MRTQGSALIDLFDSRHAPLQYQLHRALLYNFLSASTYGLAVATLKNLCQPFTNLETDSTWSRLNSDHALFEKLMDDTHAEWFCARLDGAPCTEERVCQRLAQRLPDYLTTGSQSNKVQWEVIAGALVESYLRSRTRRVQGKPSQR